MVHMYYGCTTRGRTRTSVMWDVGRPEHPSAIIKIVVLLDTHSTSVHQMETR
jgi:hypothetical protein